MILGMPPVPPLRPAALAVLQVSDPATKADQARALWQALEAGSLAIDPATSLPAPPALPGRPALPRLVPAAQVPTRSPFTLPGRAALLHAICHIEFNAIKIVFNECNHSPWTMKDEGSDGALHAHGELRARAESDARVLGHSFVGNELIAV
jgi:hypothetical protein